MVGARWVTQANAQQDEDDTKDDAIRPENVGGCDLTKSWARDQDCSQDDRREAANREQPFAGDLPAQTICR